MSSLWSEAAPGWARSPICSANGMPPGVRLVRCAAGVALLVGAGPRVRVNGLPVLGGVVVLKHRDEVLVGAARHYYSAEAMPVRQLYRLAEGDRRPLCPVCRGPLKDGDLAVPCPGCGRWYHQFDPEEGRRTKACWTYATECRFCRHPTPLTGEPGWRPGQEDDNA